MAATCKQHGHRWGWSPLPPACIAGACREAGVRLQGAEFRAGMFVNAASFETQQQLRNGTCSRGVRAASGRRSHAGLAGACAS